MSCLIEKEADAEMKQAYTEMLEGCLMEPDNRIWYAVWNMELKNVPGTIVGDFCFKGLGKDGVVEIGYGLRKEFRHQGYMVETVKVIRLSAECYDKHFAIFILIKNSHLFTYNRTIRTKKAS